MVMDAKALYERQGYALIDRIDNKYEDEIIVRKEGKKK